MKLLDQRRLTLVALLGGPGSGGAREGAGRPRGSGGDETSTGSTQEKIDKTTRRAVEVAEQLGVNPGIINVVDKEPTPFKVGDLQFREAGHYDPTTGQIEINVQAAYDDRMSVTQGIVAHECFHAMYHDVRKEQEVEHAAITALPEEDYDRMFGRNGYARPEAMKEIAQRFPVSAAFSKTWGDGYINEGKMQAMRKEDGHSSYAKAYWTPEALALNGSLERAVNETLAEVTRYQIAPASWSEKDTIPKLSSSWSKMAKDIRAVHASIKGRK